eukprot:1276255-Rhodomonas_salina.2
MWNAARTADEGASPKVGPDSVWLPAAFAEAEDLFKETAFLSLLLLRLLNNDRGVSREHSAGERNAVKPEVETETEVALFHWALHRAVAPKTLLAVAKARRRVSVCRSGGTAKLGRQQKAKRGEPRVSEWREACPS